jgi:hypothetical protein
MSLPVTHAHAITSGNTTPSNDNWAVPIYYFYVINVHVCLGKHVLVKFMTFQWKLMVLVRLLTYLRVHYLCHQRTCLFGGNPCWSNCWRSNGN